MSRDDPTEDRTKIAPATKGLLGCGATTWVIHWRTAWYTFPHPGFWTSQLLCNYCRYDNKDKLNALALAALRTMMVTQALPYW